MNGVLTGGWAYVWAAYIMTALILTGFSVRAIALFRDARRRER